MQPTNKFDSGHLLPLKEILKKNKTIKKIVITPPLISPYAVYKNMGQSNTNAAILGDILKENQTIEELKFIGQDIDNKGLIEICKGIVKNKTIRKLDLSENKRGW